jgi:natural product precursor
MKKLGKLKLNETKILKRLSNGEQKHLSGGYTSFPNDCLLAGCSLPPHPACSVCLA